MALVDIMKSLQDYPEEASEHFRKQLEIVEIIKEQSGSQSLDNNPAVGIDRSREFIPAPRPSFVRMYGAVSGR